MLTVLLVAFSSWSLPPDPDNQRSRLLAAASEAWRKNREVYSNYRMKTKTTSLRRTLNGAAYTHVDILEYWFSADDKAEVRLDLYGSPPDQTSKSVKRRADVRNVDYTFIVRQADEKSLWQLVREPRVAMSINGSELPLINIRRIDPLKFFESDAVEVADYSIDPSGTEASVSFVLRKELPLWSIGDRGNWRFDIAAGWLVKLFTYDVEDFHFSEEYSWRMERNVARPIKVIHRCTRGGKPRPDSITEYVEFALEPPPREITRLPYYGINESLVGAVLDAKPAGSWPRIALWAIIGVLTLAVIARFAMKRRGNTGG